MRQNISIWSLLGISFGITNSWLTISAALILSIYSGGPLMTIYGILIAALFALFIAISLGELASAYPASGGQYFWTMVLAPPKYAPFLAYLCGALSWAGSIFTCATAHMSISQMLVGIHAYLAGPGFKVHKWMVFLTFQIANFLTFLLNNFGMLLPVYAKLALYISLLSCAVTFITVLSCSSGHFNTAHFVFVEFNNKTGWSSAPLAFIVGLVNPCSAFACLDSATHLAEETLKPETIIPKVIMATVAIGLVTALSYAIGIFFCINDLEAVFNSKTGVPLFDIFSQAVKNRGGAVFLMVLLVATTFFAMLMIQAWATRMGWAFSRDKGLPGSRYWSQIHPTLDIPLNSSIMTSAWCALCGCLYIISTTGFGSLMTGFTVFLQLSYIIPIGCLLYTGRSNIKHGPFWMGQLGLVSNVITILWTIFCTVFFCFPATMPVTKDNMNYISVILAGFTLWAIAYWYARGRHVFSSADLHKLSLEDQHLEDMTKENFIIKEKEFVI